MQQTSEPISFGPLAMDVATGAVRVGGNRIFLTRAEAVILRALIRKGGGVVTRKELEADLYGEATAPASNGLEVMVRRIRCKISPDGGVDPIVTKRGIGYAISPELAAAR